MTDAPQTPAPRRTRRPLSRRRKVLFSLALGALTLGLVEGIARIGEWQRARRRSARTEAHYDTGLVARDGTPITQEAGGVQLVLDPELTFRLLPGHTAPGISINADGFRGPPLRPRGEAFRVLLTGGSTAFGWGASSDAACVAPHLQAELERAWGRPVEVLNAGVPSYRLAEEFDLVCLRGLDHEPDLVVSLTGYNDLFQAFKGNQSGGNQLFDQLELQLTEAYALGPALLMSSALGRRVMRRLHARPPVGEAPDRAETEARFLRLARRLSAACEGKLLLALQPLYAEHDPAARPEAERARLARYFLPWGDEGPQFLAYTREALDRWRPGLAALEAQGLRWVDLSRAFADFPEVAFDDPCHLSDAGNAYLARALAEAIQHHPAAPR
ncbi:MAG: SGNH/GDSL hydrolase family protein [Planctomycetes bacterium]|nr:SGNH/GDSL hydrolase family protein [Planctomycetota bacterium]